MHHTHDVEHRHGHDFDPGNPLGERGTRRVVLLSAWFLHGHDGHHDHAHDHGHDHAHDLNLRAAYLHVLADALTSVLAIIALLSGQFFGWDFLDPVMGIVGAVVITTWAWGLLR